MKIKVTYVSTKPVFLTDARGNTKELPVGSEISVAQWAALKSDSARTKFERVERNLSAERAAARAERYVSTIYTIDEIDTIEDPEIRETALKLVALWPHTDAGVVPFPGIVAGVDLHDRDHKTNYYLLHQGLPAGLPPMWSTANRMTQRVEKVYPDHDKVTSPYEYCTITLRTALSRAMNGKDLFAWGEVR